MTAGPLPYERLLDQVVTSFEAGAARSVTLVALVGAMAYAVAFAETLSISGFPYYEFEDRDMAYVFGSAFYGIYFIVRSDIYTGCTLPHHIWLRLVCVGKKRNKRVALLIFSPGICFFLLG